MEREVASDRLWVLAGVCQNEQMTIVAVAGKGEHVDVVVPQWTKEAEVVCVRMGAADLDQDTADRQVDRDRVPGLGGQRGGRAADAGIAGLLIELKVVVQTQRPLPVMSSAKVKLPDASSGKILGRVRGVRQLAIGERMVVGEVFGIASTCQLCPFVLRGM